MYDDVNIVAFIRKDTYTVGVRHNTSDKEYKYVTAIPGLKVDDMVIVRNITGLVMGKVSRVDEHLDIEPNAKMVYSWVTLKLDTDAIAALEAENFSIAETVRESYQNNVRGGYRNQILNGLTADALAKLPASVKPEQTLL